MLPVVDVRPEDALELPALADRDEQRAVADQRRRPERIAPAGGVEGARDVGCSCHQRKTTETTGDVETEPSPARIDEDAIRRAVVDSKALPRRGALPLDGEGHTCRVASRDRRCDHPQVREA